MSNDDSDWANLSYDDYSEEEIQSVNKKDEKTAQNKEDKCMNLKIFYIIINFCLNKF